MFLFHSNLDLYVVGFPQIHNFDSTTAQFEYVNGDSALSLQPLKGEINLAESDYTVGRVKVEVRFKKAILGKWGALEGDMPDGML